MSLCIQNMNICSLLMLMLYSIGSLHGYHVLLPHSLHRLQLPLSASLGSDLQTLSRKELQRLAKENGIKANLKTVDMIAGLQAIKERGGSTGGDLKAKSANSKVAQNQLMPFYFLWRKSQHVSID